MYAGHPLAVRVLESPTPVNFAWLMFAVYAHLNWLSGLISNAHESQFQLILGGALSSGQLRLLTPGADELVSGAVGR